MRTTLGIFLPLIIAINISAASAQEFLLRYSFPAKGELKYRKLDMTNATISAPGATDETIDRKSDASVRIQRDSSATEASSYLFVQDTIFIDEPKMQQMGVNTSEIYGSISSKRIRVLMTPRGDVARTEILDPVTRSSNPVFAFSDSMLAAQAVIFPALPVKKVKLGETWTETRDDTLAPQWMPSSLGSSTIVHHRSTTYTLKEKKKFQRYDCVVLAWKSEMKSENQNKFGESEVYSEESSVITGTMVFAFKEGFLISLETETQGDATTVVVTNGENQVIPSTTTLKSTLTLLSTH